jgi:FG-GAP-like repeat
MRAIRCLTPALTLCCGLLVAAAQAQQAPSVAHQALPIPWLVPTFMHQPPDDSVVFGSLLEAAGTASSGDWVDIAAGNFCGGSEKELVLLKNAPSNFSVLRGPAPFVVATGDLGSSSSHPWRAIAAGNLDGDAYDAIVAIRKVTSSGVPDLVVAKASSASCEVSTVVASATIGNPSNSEWVDAAVGDFEGTGRKQIALLKAAHSNFFLIKFTPAGELTIFHESDLDSSPTQPWKALAAGDLDGDGIDELIVARQVNDGHSPTVLAYKWNGSGFSLFATSTFGNNGNSDWSSVASGDFNGDGRKAVVLVKNQHSNFVVLDFPFGATQLRVLSTADLDSVKGQDWRGLTATDWLGGEDRGLPN